MAEVARDAETGISLRFIRQYDAAADLWPTPVEVDAYQRYLRGRPRLMGRLSSEHGYRPEWRWAFLGDGCE